MYPTILRDAIEKKRDNDEVRILRMNELKKKVGLSRSSIYQAIKDGKFPNSISLLGRAVGWLESDVNFWLATRINTSRSDANK